MAVDPYVFTISKVTITYILTYSTVQSPSWETNWFEYCQEIHSILWKQKVHSHTHKRPPDVPVFGQPNSVHITTSHLLEIHPYIINPSTPKVFPVFSFTPVSTPISYTNPLYIHKRHIPSRSHSSRFYHRRILGEIYRSFSSSLCYLFHSPITSSFVGPNILLNSIFSNTFCFLSSLNVKDQVSHPYRTTDKIISV